MIKRVFDLDLLLRVSDVPETPSPREDFVTFFNTPLNLMFEENGNVGLAAYSYPGCYFVHVFFPHARGREAIDLGKRMIKNLFDNYGAEILVGYIKRENKKARWAVKQIGFKSQGFLTFANGSEDEILTATKHEFMEGLKNG